MAFDFDPSSFSIETTAVSGSARGVLPLLSAFGNRPAPATEPSQPRRDPDTGTWVIPHDKTFVALYNLASRTYFQRFEEALRDSEQNALEMLRDGHMDAMLQQRMLAPISLPHSIQPEKAKDPEQADVADQVDRVIQAIPKWHNVKRALGWASWYGKAGAQFVTGTKTVDGRAVRLPVKHKPINGDKIIFGHDDVPGVLIHSTAASNYPPSLIRHTERGMALFLERPEDRSRVVINEFEPRDTDYFYESDLAGSVHGVGLRSRCYWSWFLRREVQRWSMDAVQRISTSGMLYGFHDGANPASQDAVLDALATLVQYNIASFPAIPGSDPKANTIGTIPASGVAYDVLLRFVEYFDDIIRLIVLGQSLSSQAGSTGLGSGVAELHEDTKLMLVRSDALGLADAIDEQLLQNLIRDNVWRYRGRLLPGSRLPFQLRFRFPLERDDLDKKIMAAQALTALNVPLDLNDLRDQAGFKAPAPGTTTAGPAAAVPQTAQVPQDGDKDGYRADGTPAQVPVQPNPDALAGLRLARHGRDSDSPRVMVAWALDPGTAASLAERVGGAIDDNPHLTLAYLGRLNEIDEEALASARLGLKALAAAHPALTGTIGGIGRFSASDTSEGRDVVYASADVPGLSRLRGWVAKLLEEAGCPARSDHDFTPHITIQYVEPVEPTPLRRLEPFPVTVDRIWLVIEDDREPFDLMGEPGCLDRHGRADNDPAEQVPGLKPGTNTLLASQDAIHAARTAAKAARAALKTARRDLEAAKAALAQAKGGPGLAEARRRLVEARAALTEARGRAKAARSLLKPDAAIPA